jgi:hypothetical protein
LLLDNTLSVLAREHPNVKFVRTRAGAVGFATSASHTNGYVYRDLEEGVDEDEDEGQYDENYEVDVDMLPTILVYRNGKLIHNWVRVDLVIREQIRTFDIQSLLER